MEVQVATKSSKTASNNPQVVKDIISEIIQEDFSGNVQEAAKGISEVGLSALIPRRSYKPLTTPMIYNILADKSQIKFSQLEIICGYIGIPVGAFLLFTRIKAAKRDDNQIDLQYLNSVYTMLADAFDEDHLDLKLLKEIASGNRQLDLGLSD